MRRVIAGLLFFISFSSVILRPLEATAQLNENSFTGPTWYGAGANNTYSVAVADLNNDGFPDLVSSAQRFMDGTDNHTGVFVFMNNGDGTFNLTTGYPTDGFAGSPWESVAIADVDSDGKLDLVVLNSALSAPLQLPSVSMMRGNGDGTFQAAVSYLLSIYPNTQVLPTKLTVADVNGDSKPDVLVSNTINHTNLFYPNQFRGGVSVLVNQGDGTFGSAALYDSGGYFSATDVIAADVNGDGFTDIVVTNTCSTFATNPGNGSTCLDANTNQWLPGGIGVLLGNGNGTFQTAVSYASGGITPGSVAADDLNRDGTPDLLVTNGACFQCSGTTIAVVLGNGDGSFQSPVNYNLGAFAIAPVWAAGGDVDGDGLDDAVVLSGCGLGGDCRGTVSVLLGNGDGTLGVAAVYRWFSSNLGYAPDTLVVADLNQDAKPDVVMATWNSVGFMLNQTPRAATTTTLGSQPNPSAFGQTATLTATVSSLAPGTPTGTITFTEGTTVWGTAPLANAVATLNVSNLSVGSHTLVATYPSDPAYRYSVSDPITHVVKIATTTGVSSNANPSTFNQSVKFTATVTPEFAGPVSGSVTFNDGNTVLGTVALAAGSAEFTTSSLAVGSHSITAAYDGDTNNLGSTSTALSQSVLDATTEVTVDTSPSGLTIDADGISGTAPQMYLWAPNSQHQLSTTEPQQVTAGSRLMFSSWSDGDTFTHTVTTPSSAITYTATFKTQYLLTTAANPPSGGSVTAGDWFDSGTSVPITATAAAGYSFTGFSGDLSGTVNPNSVTMDAAKSVTANFKALTTTTLGSSPNPSTFGQNVTMTATVTSQAGTPSGNVIFYDGLTNIGTQPLNGSGIATLTAALTTGLHSITASYDGNSSFLTSTSSPVAQTVNKASTSTSVSSSLNPSVAGQTVTFTALVTSTVAGRTGTVTFKDGSATLGTGAVNASGQATFSTSSLTAGTHTITADYGGDTNFLGSSSSSLSQSVTQTTTTTTLTSAPSSSTAGQPVTLTATVTSSTGGIPTGTVTFQEGKTVLGTSALNAAGRAVLIISFPVGTYTLKAVYAGTASYAGSSSRNLKQIVAVPPTTTSLTSSPNPSAVGQSVTFTATVTSSASFPNGTVTFKDGGKSLGSATLSGGQATFSTAGLKRGSHSITATYLGSSNFGGSVSPPVVQVVN